MLHQGQWQEALLTVRRLRELGTPSTLWQGRLTNLEGECRHLAGGEALRDLRFEEALEHLLESARLLRLNEAEVRARVVEAVLAEARRCFAGGVKENQAVLKWAAQALVIQSPCPEASFWEGLAQVREGRWEQSVQALETAHKEGGQRTLDPPLYLGLVALRTGRAQEAVRHLAEANRLDASCPFVALQLGLAIVAAEGDSGLAVRALQRALGPRGLPLWVKTPERAWIDAFPENRSYVRRLALKHAFRCPLQSDLSVLQRQGQAALALAHYRLGRFQEAADIYARLLQDCPPTAALLRGLGLALARLGQYDQAYKHLRTALEEENPKTALTAGYLALCGALGKPNQPEDKHNNVTWAVRLLARHQAPGNQEWAALYSRIFAEARACQLSLALEDQVRLCDVLEGVEATDESAAAAYHQLAVHFPEAPRDEHAWLYGRAAVQHNLALDGDLELLERVFSTAPAARAYFAQRNWDFEEVEIHFLSRWSAQRPGAFPAVLGPDYAPYGMNLLLSRAQHLEAAGKVDAAAACGEVLLRLAPKSGLAHDRLAQWHYRRGDLGRAAEVLADWARLEPAHTLPLVRRALLEHRRGNPTERDAALDQALSLTQGGDRAGIAFLAARLALQPPAPDWARGQSLLQACVRDDPNHLEALCCLSAVRSLQGDRDALAAQALLMDRPDVEWARFHYLAAVCHLGAGDAERVLRAAERAALDPELTIECQYLRGWAHLARHDLSAAAAALRVVAESEASPSAEHARALLGQIAQFEQQPVEAVRWWQQVAPEKRTDWQLNGALSGMLFLCGVEAYLIGEFDQAADWFRQARQHGHEDSRLGPLLNHALVRAGQQLMEGETIRPFVEENQRPGWHGVQNKNGVPSHAVTARVPERQI
jgi:tetratricopeptide (TPR) repeat protein